MPAAFTEEEIPCRPKERPAFCGSPQNRDFSRKKRFFPFSYSRQAKLPRAISTPRLGLWGNFPAGRRRQRRNRPFAVNQHKENGDSTPPVRRRRKTLTAFFAWRREIKKRFCRLLGLWPKGGGRTHPCEGRSTLFRGQTSPQVCGWLGCRTGNADRRFLWEFRAMRETSPPVTAQPAQYAPNRYIKYAVNGRGTLVQCAEKFSSG